MTLRQEIDYMRDRSLPGKPAVEVLTLSVVPAEPPLCACGAPVDPDLLEIRTMLPHLSPDLCATCYEDSRRKDEERHRQALDHTEHRRRLALLHAVVRPKILETDLGDRRFNAALFVAVQDWSHESGKWLVMHGPPGSCKTRIAGLIAKRLIIDHGLTVAWMTAGDLQEACDALTSVGKGQQRERSAIIDQLATWKRAPVLVIDDLGKNTWFPTLESRFFDLIDYRDSHYLPTILTSNRPVIDLLDDMSADRGGPTIGRITEAAAGFIFASAKR